MAASSTGTGTHSTGTHSTAPVIEVLKAHGSQNDLLLIERRPDELGTGEALAGLVRRLCDRSGPLGGADGVYFVDGAALPAQAWFVNPDGSAASFCGNGMRCVGRLLLERHRADTVRVRSGPYEFTVRRAEPTPEGVPQTVVELPPVDFGDGDGPPVVAGGGPRVDTPIPRLHPEHRFTAVSVPNPHLVALVDAYDEAELVAVGRRVAADPDTFPVGANVSYVLLLAEDEVFVRTYERGAGLTMSCGSGVAAARAVCSRSGRFPPELALVVRNRGGVGRAWLERRGGRWLPRIEGNASFVYRATVDLATSAAELDTGAFAAETAAFDAADRANLAALRAHRILPSVAEPSVGSPPR